MKKLLGLAIAMMCVGCFSQARSLTGSAHQIEAPEPTVGDLRCAAPRLTILEALYSDPSAPIQCEPRE